MLNISSYNSFLTKLKKFTYNHKLFNLTLSEKDSCSLSASYEKNSVIANAGLDQDGVNGNKVTLNASGSSSKSGKALKYYWYFETMPKGSQSILNNANSITPDFTPDVEGTYIVSLIVKDGIKLSEVDQISIRSIQKPLANAGTDRNAVIGQQISLDGSNSSSPLGKNLKFNWYFESIPTASKSTILNSNSISPTFVPDKEGLYTIKLIVNDGINDSETTTLIITVKPKVEVKWLINNSGMIVYNLCDISGPFYIDNYPWTFSNCNLYGSAGNPMKVVVINNSDEPINIASLITLYYDVYVPHGYHVTDDSKTIPAHSRSYYILPMEQNFKVTDSKVTVNLDDGSAYESRLLLTIDEWH